MSKKIITLGVILAMVSLFAGCVKREFSNDKWKLTIVSFEFLKAGGDYEDPFLKSECANEPLAIHLKLDYIGPSGKRALPYIYLREGLEKTSRAYTAHAIDMKCDEEKLNMLIKKDYYKEVDLVTGQQIFGEEGCILLFKADKTKTSFGLVVDDLQPILIKP